MLYLHVAFNRDKSRIPVVAFQKTVLDNSASRILLKVPSDGFQEKVLFHWFEIKLNFGPQIQS